MKENFVNGNGGFYYNNLFPDSLISHVNKVVREDENGLYWVGKSKTIGYIEEVESNMWEGGEIPFDKEVWVTIPLLKDVYRVSNFGRICSVGRIDRFNRKHKGVPSKGYVTPVGYMAYTITVDGKYHRNTIHRLLMSSFFDYRQKNDINHLDGDRTNNHISNLEWATRNENERHKTHTFDVSYTIRLRATNIETGEVRYYPSVNSIKNDGFSINRIAEKIGREYLGYVFEEVDIEDYNKELQYDKLRSIKDHIKPLKDKHQVGKRGEGNNSSKLNEADVLQIRKLRGQMTQKQIAEKYGITQAQVSSIQTRKTWRHINDE